MAFGIDVAAELQAWWDGEFSAELDRKFAGQAVSVVVLTPFADHDWRDPLATAFVTLSHGGERPDLVENVEHKMRFALRTGLESFAAHANAHLIEPGDFPHGGATHSYGWVAGASGLVEESDIWVARAVLDRLAGIRAAAATAAIAASRSASSRFLPDEAPQR